MKSYLRSAGSVVALAFLCAFFASCNSSTNTPTEPAVSAPSDLKAYSDDGKIGLTWTLSSTESQSDFGTYEITYYPSGNASVAQVVNVAKGNSSYIITGLTNGTRYTIQIRSKSTSGTTSSDLSTVEWSPAVRRTTYNDQGNIIPIDVYATTSSLPKSGIELNNLTNVIVESQAGTTWAANGDLFLYASSSSSTTLELRSPELAVNNPGVKLTKFWNGGGAANDYYEFDNLDAASALTAPPVVADYSENKITILDAAVSHARVYFARIQASPTDRYTVRILVTQDPSTNKLVWGTGANRYIRLQVSIQTTANNPFAKKH